MTRPLVPSFESLLEPYQRRQLTIGDNPKPLDFSGNGIIGSVNLDGRIIAINTSHPEYGYVTMSTFSSDEEVQLANVDAIRDYHARLTSESGYGLRFTSPIVAREAWLIEDAVPYIRLTLENGIIAECVTFVPDSVPAGVVQWWAFHNHTDFDFIEIEGEFRLQQSAIARLRQHADKPVPSSHTITQFNRAGYDGIACVYNSALPWAVSIGTLLPRRYDLKRGLYGAIRFEMLEGRYRDRFDHAQLQARDSLMRALFFGVMRGEDQGIPSVIATQNYMDMSRTPLPSLLRSTLDLWRGRWQSWKFGKFPIDPVMRRGLVYAMACMIPVGKGKDPRSHIAVLSDHLLLPQSINRDAYYMVMALLYWRTDFGWVVRGHLRWLFEMAERVDGFWARSYMANGLVCESSYQLKQQVYPIIELAEYVLKTGDTASFKSFKPVVKDVIDRLLATRTSEQWLFPETREATEALPYRLSSHILLWHMFNLLHQVDADIGYMAMAETLRMVIETHFVIDHEGQDIYTHAIDGEGEYQHDFEAKDMPMALMPLWGFCTADHVTWRNTMRFIFSDANKGVHDGHLGTVSQSAPWPLGDVQYFIVGDAVGKYDLAFEAEDSLLSAAQIDYALPETYNVGDGGVASRHWFGWPNAMIAYYLLRKSR